MLAKIKAKCGDAMRIDGENKSLNSIPVIWALLSKDKKFAAVAGDNTVWILNEDEFELLED